MKIIVPFLMFPLFAMLFIHCANPGKTGDDTQQVDTTGVTDPSASVNDENLTDIYWKLTQLKLIPLSGYEPQNKAPFLELKKEGNRAEGTGGCNSMGGTYELKGGNKISFSQLISTKMACPDMMMEHEFHAALEAARSYQSDGKILTLLDDAGISVAQFVASAPE